MGDSHTRRRLLATLGGVGSLGLAGCSALRDGTDSGEPDSPSTTEPETTTGVETSPDASAKASTVGDLQIAITDAEYAVLGSSEAAETATLYGGWKCPYTREFLLQEFPDVVEQYVAPGQLAVEFRAVRFQADESWGDDEPRANRAGQAIWHQTPEQFPAYVQTVFENQLSEQTEWATLEQLGTFAEEAGIEEWEPIEQSITSGEYSERWKETMDVVREKGIEGIPRLELGGRITAPILDPAATDRQLEQTLE